MGLFGNLRKNGAVVHSITVSARDKDTGEQVRSIPLPGASLSVFTDKQVRIRAIAASLEKSVSIAVTEGIVTTGGKTDPLEVALSFAQDGDCDELAGDLLICRADRSSLDRLRSSVASEFASDLANARKVRESLDSEAIQFAESTLETVLAE